MSKIAAIMTDFVEDIEITSPKEALENAGNEVVVISDNGKDHVDGKQGSTISVDQSIEDGDVSSFDALLIPGGFSPDQLRTDDRYVDFTKKNLLNLASLYLPFVMDHKSLFKLVWLKVEQ